jgi:trehalose/maltose transport system substrate-binding protein
LGGAGLAVSRYSAHPKEAIELVRFLIRAKIQSSNKGESASDNHPEIYNLPWVSNPQNYSGKSVQPNSGIVNRPSFETGRQYEQVSGAYISSVHSVLTGERGASEAAAELEKQLITLTGFRTGPPKTD